MKSFIKITILFFAMLSLHSMTAQTNKSEPLWGTPCKECLMPSGQNQKGTPATVQNGNGTIATSYTATACGLNFTQVSVRLNKRSFSITPATGVNQPATFAISGLPPCFQILKAYLYAGTSGNGIAVNASITNPAATSSVVPMAIIGTDVDKCWGYTATYTYRGDVTALISGNGNYVISGLPVTVGSNDTDGATLFIVYADPSQNYTGSIVIGDGCMVAKGGTKNATLTGFNVCGATSLTTNFMIIADLQKISATALTLNGGAYSHPIANQQVWDYIQQPGGAAVAGQTTASYGCSNASDCFNVAMAGMYFRTACNVCTATNLTVTAVTSSSCSAGSATANVVGGTAPYSYTWSPAGGNAASITNMPTGTYTVNVKDATGCKTGTATVLVNAASGPTITANAGTICAGSSVNLTANGAISYTWSPATGLNTTNGSAVVANPTVTTTYSISGTNSVGCVATITTNVVVNPMPVPVINSNSPVCINTPINLTSSGGTTYAWSGPSAFSSAVQNPTITNAQTTNGGVYTVSVTSLGCTSTATTNVSVLNPTTTASNTGPYCVGATIQLNTPAATSYAWSGPGGFTSTLQNPTRPSATTGMSGTYTVISTIGTCTAAATTSVTVNPLPTPSSSNTGPYCPGNTIQLNVGAFATYTWSGPAFSSNLQNPTISNAAVSNGGTYTVSVTDANGCVNSTVTTVVVNPSPVPVVGSNSPVCLNTTINLTASGGTSYAWSGPAAFSSAVQNPSIASAQTTNAGVYTVTVTSLGCTSTGTVSVTVLTPTTSASNTGPYCAGTTIQLNTPAATSYTWSGPGGFTSNLQNPTIPAATTAMTGTYNLIVSVGSCTANASTPIVVNALPNPIAQSNSPVCVGNTINLIGSGGTTYTWTGPGGFTSTIQSPTIPNCGMPNAGTNTLTVTNANGCKNTATVNVVVNPLPVIVVNNPTVCANQTINFTATGGASYAWSGPLGYTSNQQNPSITTAATNMTGAYTVTVTTAAGCSNTAVSNALVNALPNPIAQSNSPVCVGNTINLIGSGGTTYTWTGPGAFSSNVQSPSIPNCGMPNAGTNTLTVANANGCINSTTVNVVVNPLPTPQIVSNSPVCVGQPITFTGSGGVSYAWAGPGFINNTQNPTIGASSLSNNGTFTLVVVDANNCTNSVTANVIVNALPNVSASGSTSCENSNVSLTANGGVTYSWSGPGGFTSTSQVAVIPNAPLSASGQYTVLVTDANTCTNTAVTSIVVNPAPIPNIGTNSPVCENTSLNLTASGGVSYAWTGPNGFTSTSQNPSFIANSVGYSGNYYVTVTDMNGCTASTVIAAVINPIPNASISSTTKAGCAPLCVTFNVNASSNVTSIAWNLGNGEVGSSAAAQSCYGTTGIYTITVGVSDAIGCSNSSTYTVEVYPQPVADFNHAPIKPIINIDPEVTFTDASYGANVVAWQWYFNSTAQWTSTQQNPVFMYTEPGTYPVALVVKSDKGCMDTIVRPVVVGEDFGIYVPNAFTPNDDGMNDVFQPKGFGIVKYNLKIFDRWGEMVFETSTFEQGWDGHFVGRKGEICEEGSYTWLINVTSVFGKAHELKGHVTLIK